MVIIIAPAVPQIPQHLKKENSKLPQLYLLQELRRHGNKSNLQKTTTKQNKGKRRKKQCTHIEDTQRLVTEVVEMLQTVLYLVMRKGSKVAV